jgi:hypothetical protein
MDKAVLKYACSRRLRPEVTQNGLFVEDFTVCTQLSGELQNIEQYNKTFCPFWAKLQTLNLSQLTKFQKFKLQNTASRKGQTDKNQTKLRCNSWTSTQHRKDVFLVIYFFLTFNEKSVQLYKCSEWRPSCFLSSRALFRVYLTPTCN